MKMDKLIERDVAPFVEMVVGAVWVKFEDELKSGVGEVELSCKCLKVLAVAIDEESTEVTVLVYVIVHGSLVLGAEVGVVWE